MTEIIVAAIFAGLLVFLALTVPASGPRREGERLAVDEVDEHFLTLPGFVNEGTQQL